MPALQRCLHPRRAVARGGGPTRIQLRTGEATRRRSAAEGAHHAKDHPGRHRTLPNGSPRCLQQQRPTTTDRTRDYRPADHQRAKPGPTSTSTRPLTYTDDYAGDRPYWLIRTIQYDDRVLRPGLDVTAIDITDDGLALVAVRPPVNRGGEHADGEIYFTDGSSTKKIGELTIEHGLTYSNSGVKTSTSGSLVAWLTPSGPDPSLVVYDAHEHRVLADVPRPECVRDNCSLATVMGDRV